MNQFPLFADLRNRRCLVIGGGEVASRKIELLLRSGARVSVNAPELNTALARHAATGRIEHIPGRFEPALVADAILVIAATSDRDVNARVADAAASMHRLCNVVDDAELSSCIIPAIVDRSPIVIAVGTGGEAPVLARRLRQQIETWLPDQIGKLATWAGKWRAPVQDRIGTHAGRLRFWESVFDGKTGRDVLAGKGEAADAQMPALLNDHAGAAAGRGVAWIVGAGPGDPGLLTRRALQLLQTADVVLHDRLVSSDILEFARRDAQIVSVGKSPGGPSTAQEHINRQLVALVAAGHRVCRLKGGDPFVFGRGAEEIAAVAAAGLDWEVVPGITSANGCAAAAGIPLTHRDHANAVTLVTAHRADGAASEDPDWPGLARGSQTLVIYMGVRRLQDVSRKLVDHGRPANTAAALIENGTTERQRVVGGTLGDIAKIGAAAEIRPPAILIVGDVVGVADKLHDMNNVVTDKSSTVAATN
ncbi:MAG: siroheme synthase CysG [Gammaproteobacteria bacterium]|nr:siroheme synthase CysG [Gammaproteobacteria bacterium]